MNKKPKSLIGEYFVFPRRSRDGDNIDLVDAVVIGPQGIFRDQQLYNVAMTCVDSPDYAAVAAMDESLIRELMAADQAKVRQTVEDFEKLQTEIAGIQYRQHKLLNVFKTPYASLDQISLISDPGDFNDPSIPF